MPASCHLGALQVKPHIVTMCVKTKTEWSCGCSKKVLSTCHDAPNPRTPCSHVDKYRYLDEGDCKECKAGGTNVTRGQDGYGRYAREIAARDKKAKRHSTRAILGEITGNEAQTAPERPQTPLVTPDPWMKATRREKEWESPHRRHADEEWVREHARRKEDIESLAQSHSSSPKRRSSPRTPEYVPARHVYECDVEDSLIAHHQRRNSGSLQAKVQQISNTMSRTARPRASRHNSFESIESVPSRGRSRTLPYQYGYATDFGYAIENRVPRDVYEGGYPAESGVYRRRL